MVLPNFFGDFDRWVLIITEGQPWRNASLMTERLEIWAVLSNDSLTTDNILDCLDESLVDFMPRGQETHVNAFPR